MDLTIENIEKLSSILGLFLIFCGIVKIYFYYKSFGLSITPYIKLSEILTLFLENFMVYLLIAGVVTGLSLNFFFKLELEKQGLNELTKLNLRHQIIFMLKNLNPSIVVAFILQGLYLLIFALREKIKSYEVVLAALALLTGCFLTPIVSVLIKIFLKSEYQISLHIIYVFYGLLLISLIIFAIVMAKSEAYKVKNHNYFENTVYEFDDSETIISTQTKYYIGRTEGFIFFYDESNRKPIVYPASRLKKNYSS